MSRPTHRDKGYLESTYQAYGPGGVIDFAPPHLAAAYGEPSIYAQAGFPGYQQPLGYQYAPTYPAPTYPASFPLAAPPVACQEEAVSTQDLHERINAKIDSIINAQRASAQEQKADLLGSQIERLTRKVQKLSASMEGRREDGFCHALAAKQRGGGDEEEELESHENRVESRLRDESIASRLRRLAAESKLRERRAEQHIPDW